MRCWSLHICLRSLTPKLEGSSSSVYTTYVTQLRNSHQLINFPISFILRRDPRLYVLLSSHNAKFLVLLSGLSCLSNLYSGCKQWQPEMDYSIEYT